MLPPSAPPQFNATAAVRRVDVGVCSCFVVDDALSRPQAWVDWAASQAFEPAEANAYPGSLLAAPPELESALDGWFAHKVRSGFEVRRTLSRYARFALLHTPAAALSPGQRLCHRDRVVVAPALCVASVLYLFGDARLGGTAFYRPRGTPAQTHQLINDAQTLDDAAFQARYGVAAAYMTASNELFELTGVVPAAWNRLIFYDGGQFHSGHIERPDLLTHDVRTGRLSLNGFFACRQAAR